MAGIAVLAIGYVLSQFYRSFLAVLTPALTAELGMSNVELSVASGAWFVMFALSQFAVGISLDSFGPRRTASVLLAGGGALGAFLFSLAASPWMVIAAMALIGIGCAPVLMAALVIFAHKFSPARFAVLASWMLAFGTAGNVMGASPLAWVADAIGWRASLAALGGFTLLTALAVHALVKDPVPPQGMVRGAAGLAGYGELLRLKVLWPIIPLTAINYAPPTGIRGLWAGPYLADVYGADALLIGQVTTFMAMAMVAGAFIYGPLDTLFGTRKWVAAAGNAVNLLALAWLALHPVPGIAGVTALFVVFGLCGGSYGLLQAHARAFTPAHLTGRGVTLMNFFAIGGAGVMQLATGGVVSAASVPGDPSAAYAALFATYAASLGLAIAIYLFSRDARPEKTKAAAGEQSA
jgi:sugar phosphate permease